MTDPNFMVDFLKNCVANGDNTTESIVEAAQTQIKEIDDTLMKMDNLKIRKVNLQGILKQLGTAEKPQQEAADWDFSMSLDQMGEYRCQLLSNICDYIDEVEKARASKVIEAVASYEEQKQVYWAIKWLSARQIIKHDQDRNLVKGESWNERPLQNDQSGTSSTS